MSELSNNRQNEFEEVESFDTKGLLLDYLAHWKWFILGVVVAIGLGIFYIATVIPTYKIESAIYLSDDAEERGNAFSLDAANPLVNMKSFIDETEIQILKSRNNLVKIVDSLNLCYTYYREGALRNIPLYENNAIVAKMDSASLRTLKSAIRVTVSQSGDSTYDIKVKTRFNQTKETKELNDVTLPVVIDLSHGQLELSRSTAIPEMEGTELITIVSPRMRAKAMAEDFTIDFAKNSEKIINVSYVDNVPMRGIDIINALLDFYNRNIIADKNQSAIQTEAFILDRLVMITDELRDVENRLQAYRSAHNITDMQMQSNLNLTLQSNYQGQLAEAEASMAVLDEIERIVSSAGTYQLLPSAVDDPSISQIIDQYNLRVNQLHRALEGSTVNSPLVASMQDELNRQKVRIMQTIVSAKRNLNARISNIEELERQSIGQLASTPTVDKGLQEIFREQSVKVNIYTFLLQRREEIALQKTMATNTARLIDDPTDDVLIAPKKLLILVAAFLLGLLVPAAFIYVRRMIFPRFSDQEELERMTKIPIIGEISVDPKALKAAKMAKKKGAKDYKNDIVIGQNVNTPIAELFRLLRNNINFLRRDPRLQVILVTSAISGEGKTFITTNLAMTYALAGKKVVVIGADVRRPMLAKRFGLTNQRGLTTYLSGQEEDLNKLLVQSTYNPNLYILPAGPIPPNPNELLMSDNMEKLINTLRGEYDYILIDSAPIGVISDSFLIVEHTDVQIFVTRADYSTRGSLKTLHDAVQLKKLPNAYIVLNGVNMQSSAYVYRRYGGYNSHGYSYHYGYNKKP